MFVHPQLEADWCTQRHETMPVMRASRTDGKQKVGGKAEQRRAMLLHSVQCSFTRTGHESAGPDLTRTIRLEIISTKGSSMSMENSLVRTSLISLSLHVVYLAFHADKCSSAPGKIVGMLLEGLPAEQLARLGHEDNLSELKALVATVSKFLEIQRLGLASIDILSERELSQLDFLVATAVSCLLMLFLAIP